MAQRYNPLADAWSAYVLGIVVRRADGRASALASDTQEPQLRCYVPISAPYSGSGRLELAASIAMAHEPSGCFSRISRNLPLSVTGSGMASVPTASE